MTDMPKASGHKIVYKVVWRNIIPPLLYSCNFMTLTIIMGRVFVCICKLYYAVVTHRVGIKNEVTNCAYAFYRFFLLKEKKHYNWMLLR